MAIVKASWVLLLLVATIDSASAQCDETLRSPAGVIQSPGYPGDYPSRMDYTWCVDVQGATGIDITFLGEFHLEINEDNDGTDVCKDALEIGAGIVPFQNSIGLFCGNSTPPAQRVDTRQMWVNLFTDRNVEISGFQLIYRSELDVCYSSPCTNGGTCMSDLTTYTYTCHCPSGWEGIIFGVNCEIVLLSGVFSIEASSPSPSTEEELTLTCRATGWIPAATISWYRGDVDSPVDAGDQEDAQVSDGTFTSTRNLTFSPTKGDNGVTYGCVVRHPALSSDAQTHMTLNVRYPAEIVTPLPDVTRVTQGQSANISCPADGNPDTFIYTWTEGDRVMDPSTEHKYIIGDGVLTIVQVTSDLQGTVYSCEVTNNVGFTPAKASTVLIVDISSDASSTVHPTASSPDTNSTTTIIIAVVVVCVVVLIAVIVAAVFVIRRTVASMERQHSSAPDEVTLEQIPGSPKDGYQSLRLPRGRLSTHTYQGLLVAQGDTKNQPTTDSVYEDVKTSSEFPRSKLTVKEKLGQGRFGDVFRAEALNMSGHPGITIVAVKTLKSVSSPAASLPAFFKELDVLEMLGSHPNVVSFLGCCTDEEPFYLLLEYVSGGSLQSNLRASRTQQTYNNLHGGSKSLSSRVLTKFAWDVAKGMNFLSSRKIIHRDLATRNVLVAADRTCKVSDFGISREGEVYERRANACLPIRWMAPESLFQRLCTVQSDVWSFGVLLWEIVTLGATPYPGMTSRQVMGYVKHGYRMEKPPHCDDKIYKIMAACWEEEPTDRPSFQDLEHAMETLIEEEYINLANFNEAIYANPQTSTEEKC
ncbi:PREDICTED: fibroblast growth factor receptor 4-like [Branchiostoma belcheri]|uniref:receptor protein-tyrosine kinase n=1 Tax=Branchiostoma belcheri TaxID=7741 RepID=A0A6P4XJ27_BRABE|nr:PREDICTED: fibroblast growth factor receptor 4-like [Branchiostoma belcheri]